MKSVTLNGGKWLFYVDFYFQRPARSARNLRVSKIIVRKIKKGKAWILDIALLTGG